MNDKKELKKKILVTGGGSGGHVSAAESIITAINNQYSLNTSNFLYVGGDLGMVGEKSGNSVEQRRFKNVDFNCKYIRAGKLQRVFNLQTIKLLLRTILGFIDSYKILKRYKPDIIISTGGFVTVPVCTIGKFFKSKIYLHEQTATVGLSNKIVSHFSEKIFITFPSSSKYFPKEKTVHTGNLVRPEIFHKTGKGYIVNPLKKMIEKQEELPIIYISGGSLGSHIINETVRESLIQLLENFQVILQTGDHKVLKDYDILLDKKKSLDSRVRDRFLPVKYIEKDEIGFLFDNIDLFVGRAGANTVYEVGVLQIPSIFIPIPWVTNNEQFENAKTLKDLGLSEILPEGELTPEQLVLKIKKLHNKKKNFNKEKLSKTFPVNASDIIISNLNL